MSASVRCASVLAMACGRDACSGARCTLAAISHRLNSARPILSKALLRPDAPSAAPSTAGWPGGCAALIAAAMPKRRASAAEPQAAKLGAAAECW
jgi:hypothetical protein